MQSENSTEKITANWLKIFFQAFKIEISIKGRDLSASAKDQGIGDSRRSALGAAVLEWPVSPQTSPTTLFPEPALLPSFILSEVQFSVQTGQIKALVCSQIIYKFFSNSFLSSAATVCYTGKCNALIHVILMNMSADLGKHICFFSAKANQCVPVFSFWHRSVVCWDLPTVTEQDFGLRSNSVYFWI